MRTHLFGAAVAAAMATSGGAFALSDQRDFDAMFKSLNELMQFAAPGRSVNWGNEQTGNKGTITTTGLVNRSGRQCWSYRRTFTDKAGIKQVDGIACEKFPGLWEIVDEGAETSVSRASGSAQAKSETSKSSSSKSEPPAPAKTQTAATPKKPGYDRATVRETQRLLTDLGYNPGPIDGAFGGKTRRAIEKFERDRNYPVTGKPSSGLVARLRDAEPQPAAASTPAEPRQEPAAAEPASSEPATAAVAPEPLEPAVLLEAAPPVPSFEPPTSAASGPGHDGSTVSGLPPPPPPPPSD